MPPDAKPGLVVLLVGGKLIRAPQALCTLALLLCCCAGGGKRPGGGGKCLSRVMCYPASFLLKSKGKFDTGRQTTKDENH